MTKTTTNATVDAHIEARRQDKDFTERLRKRHEEESALYDRLTAAHLTATGDEKHMAQQLRSTPTLGWSMLRRGIVVAGLIATAAVFVGLNSQALMLATLYFALATACLADYGAFRIGGAKWILPPRVALISCIMFFGLMMTMVVAAVTKI